MSDRSLIKKTLILGSDVCKGVCGRAWLAEGRTFAMSTMLLSYFVTSGMALFYWYSFISQNILAIV